jgi:hypothetical protein
MVVEMASQSQSEPLRVGGAWRACSRGRVGRAPWVALPTDHRLEHLPARHPEDVACHRRQLDLGVFQELLHALLLPGPLPDQAGSACAGSGSGHISSHQVTRPADRLWRHKAWPAHAPLDHLASHTASSLSVLGRPGTFLGVLDVLDVLGVEQPAGESFGFQQ